MTQDMWQLEFAKMKFIGEAGGGLVKVTVDGLGYPVSVEIDESLLINKDKQFISDLFCAATADGIKKADAYVKEYMTNKLLEAYDRIADASLDKGDIGNGGGYKTKN